MSIIDENSIPEETKIHHARQKNYVQNFILVIGLLIGVYFCVLSDKNEERLLGVLLCAITASFLYINGRINENRKVQIILNSKGIQTATTDFQSWKDVSNETIEYNSRTGRFLNYDFISGSERVFIDNLDVTQDYLELLLKTYRHRYHKINS